MTNDITAGRPSLGHEVIMGSAPHVHCAVQLVSTLVQYVQVKVFQSGERTWEVVMSPRSRTLEGSGIAAL